MLEDQKKRLEEVKTKKACLRKLIARNKRMQQPSNRINFPFVIAA